MTDICKHCNRKKGNHKAVTFNCPVGRGNFPTFLSNQFYEPKESAKKETTMIGYCEYYYLEKNHGYGKPYIDQLFVIKKTDKNLICATGTIFNGEPTSKSHIALDDPCLFSSYKEAVLGLREECSSIIGDCQDRINSIEVIYNTIIAGMYEPRKGIQILDAKDIDPSKLKI